MLPSVQTQSCSSPLPTPPRYVYTLHAPRALLIETRGKRTTDEEVIEKQELMNTERKIVISEMTAPSLVWQAHGTMNLEKLPGRKCCKEIWCLPTLTQQASKACLQYAQNKPSRDPRPTCLQTQESFLPI